MKKDIQLPGLYIMGTQRSGTTLLCRIISSHPGFFVQNEGLPVRKIFVSEDSIDDIRTNMNALFAVAHNGISINDFLKQRNIDSWGYKDPQLTEYLEGLDTIVDTYGNTVKFVLTVRDARGVVNSYIENKWGLGTNAYTGALRWKTEVQAQLEFMKKHQDLFMLVRFEDLIENMEATVRSICEHIGLEYDPSMLLYHQNKAKFRIKRESINTNREPDIAIAQKWRKSLTQHEIDIVEHVARDELVMLGYDVDERPVSISRIEKMYYRIHQKIIGEIQLRYRWRKAAVSDFLEQWRSRSH